MHSRSIVACVCVTTVAALFRRGHQLLQRRVPGFCFRKPFQRGLDDVFPAALRRLQRHGHRASDGHFHPSIPRDFHGRRNSAWVHINGALSSSAKGFRSADHRQALKPRAATR